MRTCPHRGLLSLCVLALGLSAPVWGAPTDGQALAPAQRLELETLKTQLADPTRAAQTKREAAALLLTRTYPQAAALVRDFLNDDTNRPAQIAIAEAIPQVGRVDGEFIKPLLAMLTGKEPSLRAPAAAALVAFKDDGVLNEFIKLVTDQKGNLATRLVVVEAMRGVLDKKAIDALIGLLDDANETVVNAACDTLTRLTSIRPFKRDVRLWKSWWAQNKHKPQSDWLADLAENLAKANQELEKENAAARKRLAAAMTGLYSATPVSGRDALLEEMFKDAVAEVRLAGCQLMQARLAQTQPLGDSLRSVLRAGLSDADSGVRQAAAILVASSNDEQAAKLLSGRLASEPASEVREAIYQAMGLLREPAAWDQLLSGVERPDRREAAAAAAALARIAEKDGPSDERRGQAVAALRKRYGAAPGADQAALREALLGAMAAFGGKELAGLLTSALKDDAATVRLGAIKALQKLAVPETVSAVAPLAGEDPDRGVRLAAIAAMGTLGGLDNLQTVLARTDAKVEPDPAVRDKAWQVAMDYLAKADTAKLAALADEFSKRDDANEFLVRLLKLWAGKVAADKPEVWVPVRLRLGEVLLAGGRPGEAAVELSAAHAALVGAKSPDAAKVWTQWIDALLAGDDPAAAARIAENGDDEQTAPAVGKLLKRLETLKARKEWDSLLRLAEAAAGRLDKRLADDQRRQLAALIQDAQAQQRLADRQRVSALAARLLGTDEAAKAAAAKDLALMKGRAAGPLCEELRLAVSAAKGDPSGEKALLDVLLPLAPQLKGYDANAPAADRLKVVDGWLQQLNGSGPTTKPATRPATAPA